MSEYKFDQSWRKRKKSYCSTVWFFRDVLDRQLQAEKSASILSNTTNPVVMLSYITNPPGSRDYRRIVDYGRVKVKEKHHVLCTFMEFVVLSFTLDLAFVALCCVCVCVCRTLIQTIRRDGVSTSSIETSLSKWSACMFSDLETVVCTSVRWWTCCEKYWLSFKSILCVGNDADLCCMHCE